MIRIERQHLKRALLLARAKKIVQYWTDALSATTTYSDREPRRRIKIPWRTFYVPKTLNPGDGKVDAEGKVYIVNSDGSLTRKSCRRHERD
jgi:hypothetical protein